MLFQSFVKLFTFYILSKFDQSLIKLWQNFDICFFQINPAYNPISKVLCFFTPVWRLSQKNTVPSIPPRHHRNTPKTPQKHHQNMSKTPKTSPNTVKTPLTHHQSATDQDTNDHRNTIERPPRHQHDRHHQLPLQRVFPKSCCQHTLS